MPRVVAAFGADRFDYVHAQNCVDHMAAPLAAIEEMLRVVKPGCVVFLSHAEKEAEKQSFSGLHQWNLTCRQGDLVIDSPGAETINVSDALGHLADFKCTLKDEWLTIVARRRG